MYPKDLILFLRSHPRPLHLSTINISTTHFTYDLKEDDIKGVSTDHLNLRMTDPYNLLVIKELIENSKRVTISYIYGREWNTFIVSFLEIIKVPFDIKCNAKNLKMLRVDLVTRCESIITNFKSYPSNVPPFIKRKLVGEWTFKDDELDKYLSHVYQNKLPRLDFTWKWQTFDSLKEAYDHVSKVSLRLPTSVRCVIPIEKLERPISPADFERIRRIKNTFHFNEITVVCREGDVIKTIGDKFCYPDPFISKLIVITTFK